MTNPSTGPHLEPPIPRLAYDPARDKLRDECGVFGIFDHEEAARITALGLHALQHRGQESAGIVTFDQGRFYSERHIGLVGDHFTRQAVMNRLPGRAAIGHNRYSTTGEPILRNVQPLFAELDVGGIALCHNGNFTNALGLRKSLIRQGAIFQSTSDSEVVLHLIAKSSRPGLADRFIDAIRQMQGAYSLVALTPKKLIGARDPFGIRPLVLGKVNGMPILTSETCALDIIGADFVREVENGEVVVCTEDGIKSLRPFPPVTERPCIFEFIYFSRPDSILGGKSIYNVRKRLGAELARESAVAADVVVPVPDSGVPSALGYANQAKQAFELGIIRNHYVGRTFIEPTQQIRDFGVRLKHSANREQLRDRRVVLVDDSIVRGTTSRKIVQMVRDVGAREVHMRISSPPIAYPDFYGIDTPNQDRLLAHRFNLEEMRNWMQADTLAFLSIDGLYRAMGHEGRNPLHPQYTDHCFTGAYPTPLADRDSNEQPKQMSLLSEPA